MARSPRYSEAQPKARTAYSPPASDTSRYERRGSAPEPRARRHDDYPRRPVATRDDSYYDPRDKYYLSGDEDAEYSYKPSRSLTRDSASRKEAPTRASSSDRYHHDSVRRSSADSATSHSTSRHSSSRHSRSGAGGRGRDSERERYYPPSASRNTKDMRAGKRPGASRTYSSSRSSSGSGRSINSQTDSQKQKDKTGMLSSAMRCALEAGAVAALKQRNDPSPWLGMKGTKVAAAAIGAAAIDTFMERKAPKRKGGMSHIMMRQATTMALGNLVLGPAAKGTVMGRTA